MQQSEPCDLKHHHKLKTDGMELSQIYFKIVGYPQDERKKLLNSFYLKRFYTKTRISSYIDDLCE